MRFCLFTHELHYVWICFIPMFRVFFAGIPSQCAPAGTAEQHPTHFYLPGQCTIHCFHDLPHFTEIFVLLSTENCIFTSLFMFKFKYVWTCFIPMFNAFVMFPSQCAPIGSAERPWAATQKDRFHYLGVQEQSKFPFVCWHNSYSCLFNPVHTPPTSHLNWSEGIPSHPNISIKIP